jgi:hypothetical protein
VLAGCGRTPAGDPSVRVIDFVKQIGHADKRPPDAPVEPAEHIVGGRPRASLVVPVPSRLTWTTTLPDRGVLRASVALPDGPAPASARFRIGISDNRFYEKLGEWVVSSGPTSQVETLSLDLSRFSGRHISLLFPPTGRSWRLIFAVDAVGGTRTAYWGEPGIDTDARSARAYFTQRTTAPSQE